MSTTKKFINYKQEYDLTFAKMPMELFSNPKYATLDMTAVVLYSLLINRTSLSRKNHWWDKKTGNIYVFFSRENAQEHLRCGANKATDAFRQLRELGLIEEVEQNGKKANKIFVLLPDRTERNTKKEKVSKQARQTIKQKSGEVLKAIHKQIKSKTKKLEHISKQLEHKQHEKELAKEVTISKGQLRQLSEKFELSHFKKHYDKYDYRLVKLILRAIAEMTTYDFTKVADSFRSRDELIVLFHTLTSGDMASFLAYCKQHISTAVRNKKAYLKSMLVNYVENLQIDLACFEPIMV